MDISASFPGSGQQFQTSDDLTAVLHQLPKARPEWREQARRLHLSTLTDPGDLGRLAEIAVFLSGWGTEPGPSCDRPQILVFSGGHEQCVASTHDGGLCRRETVEGLATVDQDQVHIVSVMPENRTADISTSPAMTESEALAAMRIGFDAVSPDADIIGIGAVGPASSLTAAAISAATFGGWGADWFGASPAVAFLAGGTPARLHGPERATQSGLETPVAHIDRALKRMRASNPRPRPLDILRNLGGHETLAVVGAVLAARLMSKPVLVDGYSASSALAPLFAENLASLSHVMVAHVGRDVGYRRLLQNFKKRSLLDLELMSGDGTAALLAMAIMKRAAIAHQALERDCCGRHA